MKNNCRCHHQRETAGVKDKEEGGRGTNGERTVQSLGRRDTL